jgi:hypothetical protein
MSQIKLSSNASGTGVFTLESPATNTNRTLTLPDATGTIITTAGGAAISGTTGTFTGLVDISAAGAGQIKFPATQNASSDANTLDDYEEGTWTPTLSSQSGSITTTNVGTGYYTKVGNAVTIYCQPQITTNGTAGTALYVGGLPFTAKTSTGFGGAGREDAVTGLGFIISTNSSTSLYLQKYDSNYLGGNSYRYPILLTYLT